MDVLQVLQVLLQGGTITALGVALAWIKDLQLQIRVLEQGRKDDSTRIAVLYERLMREENKKGL